MRYIVKPGFVHGANDQYKAGDIVEMSEIEAAPLLDKLELVAELVTSSPTTESPVEEQHAKNKRAK